MTLVGISSYLLSHTAPHSNITCILFCAKKHVFYYNASIMVLILFKIMPGFRAKRSDNEEKPPRGGNVYLIRVL